MREYINNQNVKLNMAVIFDSVIYDIILAISFLGFCLNKFLTSTYNYWKDRGIPYIDPVLFFGNVNGSISFTENYQNFYDAMKGERYLGVYEIRTPVFVVRDPELAEQIMIKDFVHFHDRGFPFDPEHDPLSNNLFFLKGHSWRNLRYKLALTFTSGKLKGMFEQICHCGEGLVNTIEEESKANKAIEGKPLLTRFTLEVIASVAFGLQFHKDNEDCKNFIKATDKIFQPTKMQIVKTVLVFIFPSLKSKIGLKQFSKEAEDIVMSLVQRTLNYRRENNITRSDFLQLLLNLQKQEKDGNVTFQKDLRKELDYNPEDEVIDQMKHVSKSDDEDKSQEKEKEFMTDEIIAAQALIFFSAGSESTSSTVNFALYFLSQHPGIQKKVHDEIDSVLLKYNNKWTFESVREMIYLEQVIQETLRIYPVSSMIFRVSTKPYKVPGSTLVLDEGVKVVIPVLAIHNDPQHYESPQEFNPDRFEGNNFKPSGTYFPFGNGPRICIAMRFAALEVKMVLSRILSQYSVKLSPKTQLPLTFNKKSFLLTPENGLWFEFEKRVKL